MGREEIARKLHLVVFCRRQVCIMNLYSAQWKPVLGRDVVCFAISYSTESGTQEHAPASVDSQHVVYESRGMQYKCPGARDGLWSHHPGTFPSSLAF